MNILRDHKASFSISLVLVMTLLAGCAAKGKGMAQGDDECSAAKSAGAGAILGGLLGSALGGKNGALKGAAAGALVGGLGCMAMNYHTEKVRTAQQVNKQYIEENEKLPPQPAVTSYSLSAPKQVVRGNPVSVNSSITVVDGSSQSVKNVEEKLFITNENGERKQIKTKDAQASMNSGGEYSNSFSFTPPNGVAEGSYRLESEVYVNDQLAKTAQAPIVLALNGNVMTVAFAK
jgi:hypothetical protein